MDLYLNIPGATSEEIARGVAAARSLFDTVGITPYEAAAAHFRRVAWGDAGFQASDAPTEAESRAADAWTAANAAAVKSCCLGWSAKPSGGCGLLLKDADQPR